MAIDTIITNMASVQQGIDGVKVAYVYAPAKLGPLPAFANFLSSGDISRVAQAEYRVHVIKMQLYVVKGILPEAEKQLRPFLEKTLTAFNSNITLSGAVDTSAITNYEYGGMDYGGHDYLGISFDFTAVEFLAQNYA